MNSGIGMMHDSHRFSQEHFLGGQEWRQKELELPIGTLLPGARRPCETEQLLVLFYQHNTMACNSAGALRSVKGAWPTNREG